VLDLKDPRIARIVKQCQDLPGQELFQYLDENGAPHDITSHDVNQYLHDIAGEHFSAKDFRTWAGTLLCALTLREFDEFRSATEAKKNVTQAIKTVAERLGNTPAICRKSYVHPTVLETYLDGTMLEGLAQRVAREADPSPHALRPDEAEVIALLQRSLDRQQQKAA
jgi:DNA topoisomerase-1